jgi:hypothetical protein
MVRVFASIPKVKGSNLMSGVVCGNNGMLTKYFPIEFSIIGALVDYVVYLG